MIGGGPNRSGDEGLRAVVVSGRREAAGFVAVPWVREQLASLLGVEPYAGTLNLELREPQSRAAWRWRSSSGACLTIAPGQAGFCAASYFPVVLNDTVRGGIVLPHVEEYPPHVVEVVAGESLRERLGLRDGDEVTLSWEAVPPTSILGPDAMARSAPAGDEAGSLLAGGAATAKDRHIEACLSQDVESTRGNGFDAYELVGALPDFAFGDIDTTVELFGRRLALPLLISSMTGGGRRSGEINARLAESAQRLGLGMAVGSQKLMLRDPAATSSFLVRRWAPDILLFADLGLVHLNYGLSRAECLRAVEAIAADALLLYVNPMHEALQPSGDVEFAGLLGRLADLLADFPYPVVVKEVGFGLPESLLRRLGEPPFAASVGGVETAGLGGTHWGRVEALIAGRPLGSPDEDLGVPTADCLAMAVRLLPPGMPIIASGGIRNGVEAAKALAMGASAVGMALPFLRWAAGSVDAIVSGVAEFERQLRLALWYTGSRDVSELRGRFRPAKPSS